MNTRSIRIVFLALLAWFWCYSASVFSPWAASAEARLWLYDLHIYSGFALVVWGAGECLALLISLRRGRERSRPMLSVSLLILAASAGLSHYLLSHSSLAWGWRVWLSSEALSAYTEPVYDDRRRRIGWLLIDTFRAPCGDQAWLWLGRPFGGGTGINRALVHSPGGVPLTPQSDAFRFVRVDENWWMAYQHPERYRPGGSGSCVSGVELPSHASALSFMTG